jgi:hypothetical protein
VDKILYVLFLTGICIWQLPALHSLYMTFRSRVYIRRNLKKVTSENLFLKRSPLGQHLALVIEGAETEKFFTSLENFYLISLILGAGSGLAAYLATGPFMALLCGIFMGLLPYTILMARLYGRRVSRSKEGDVLLQELLNNYKIHDFNIKEAIEVTAAELDKAPESRKLLLQLAKGLQKSVTKEEVDQHLTAFRYGIDTAWGNALSTNIFFAYLYGVRVDNALEDLLASMIKSRKVIEHGKRENNEAKLILKYLAPVSFLLTVVGACRYFGFTPTKFIRYQFGTVLGLQWFLIMTMMYLASLLLNVFLSREKMDI